MHVTVDPARCQGHGRCNLIAPEVFEIDDLGYASVPTAAKEVPERRRDRVLLAVNSCPEAAIAIDSAKE
jgi:ferredoxin